MLTSLSGLRSTRESRALGATRIFLGVLFISTGVMKFVVPMLADAWSGQLTQAGIPFYAFNVRVVPVVEILVGIELLFGYYTRVGAVVVLGMMAVATYVHIVVDDPSLFPLQLQEPVVPIFVIAMATYVLVQGGGSWSLDLGHASQSTAGSVANEQSQ